MPLDVVSANGARQQLKEARERVPLAWKDFLAGYRAASASAEERKLVEAIGKELDGLKPLFDEIDAAYEKDNKEAIAAILREKWPRVHKSLIKPLSELIPARVAAMNRTFDASQAEGERLSALAVGANVAGAIALALVMLPLVRSLTRAIGEMRRAGACCPGRTQGRIEHAAPRRTGRHGALARRDAHQSARDHQRRATRGRHPGLCGRAPQD
jgi:hypothetical protein